jgi:hypothetical protein
VVVVVSRTPVLVVVVLVVVVVAVDDVLPVGMRTTGLLLSSPLVGAMIGLVPPDAGGVAPLDDELTVARVARTVASTTPEPARMIIALDWVRFSGGGPICAGPVASVTASAP